MSDTNFVEKIKKVGTGSVLVTLGTVLVGAAIVWIFDTVHTNSKNSAILVNTMPKVVEELKQMRVGNNEGHLAIFDKLSEIEMGFNRIDLRVGMLERDCSDHNNDIEKCKEHMFTYPNGGAPIWQK